MANSTFSKILSMKGLFDFPFFFNSFYCSIALNSFSTFSFSFYAYSYSLLSSFSSAIF